MTTTTQQILAAHDIGDPVQTIARALQCSASTVYSVLRAHRPSRQRKPRQRTSEKRPQIAALLRAGTDAAEVAKVLDVSRAWVYRVRAET